jgi:hypothetical protein
VHIEMSICAFMGRIVDLNPPGIRRLSRKLDAMTTEMRAGGDEDVNDDGSIPIVGHWTCGVEEATASFSVREKSRFRLFPFGEAYKVMRSRIRQFIDADANLDTLVDVVNPALLVDHDSAVDKYLLQFIERNRLSPLSQNLPRRNKWANVEEPCNGVSPVARSISKLSQLRECGLPRLKFSL